MKNDAKKQLPATKKNPNYTKLPLPTNSTPGKKMLKK